LVEPNLSSPGLAAWIVRAGRLDGTARGGIENTGEAGTSLANCADLLRRAVRDFGLEYQGLLEVRTACGEAWHASTAG